MLVSLLALLVQVPPVVVVDDATGCVAAEALRVALPSLPDDSALEVRGEEAMLAVRAQVPGAAPLIRTVPRSSTCEEQVATIARVVDRYVATVPVPRRDINDDNDDDDDDEPAPATETVAASSPVPPTSPTSLQLGAQVQGTWSTTWSRLSALPQLRWQYAIDDNVSIGIDGAVRVGVLTPVAVGDGHVGGADVVGRVLSRATFRAVSVMAGVEGGVLALRGQGYGDGAVAYGPTVNGVVGVGVQLGSVVVDVVVGVPLTPAVALVGELQVVEAPVSLGLAVGAVLPAW